MSRDGTDAKPGDATRTADDPEQEVQALERRVEAIRGHLDGVVGEMDQRWHRLWTLPPALRRHVPPLAVTGTLLAWVAAGAVIMRLVRRRRRRRQVAG